MSVFTENAAAFATTREQRQAELANAVDNELDKACKNAISLIRMDEPGRARYELTRAGIKCECIAEGRYPR